MIVDRPTTSIIMSYASSILMLVVESLSMKKIIIVGFAHVVDIEMPIVVNTLVVPPILSLLPHIE